MKKSLLLSKINLVVLPVLLALAACGPIGFGLGKSQPTTTGLVPGTGGTPSVTVHDQATDGTSVVVEDVVSQGPGWMVIHAQANGTIGDAIGETALKPGDNKNVIVKIDPTKATSVMYAMLHVDAGIVGQYEFPGPDVPVMINGQMLSPAFNATMQMASAPTATSDNGMSMTTPSGSGAALTVKVSDQALTGNAVMIDDVVSAGPGWVVIYTTNAAGQPDQPIGYAAVKDGDTPMVTVPVDPAKAQGTLIAQLHVDKGVIGKFEYPGPDEPVMSGVQMIAATFKILSQSANNLASPGALQPSITVLDQIVQNGSVTVQQVVSNGNWWLVIHRQNQDGTMGEYIGQTLIKNGINSNVVVKINMNLATPVLYAMLHYDNPPIGILQFPGPDAPVMLNGQMIAPSFKVSGLSQDVTIDVHAASGAVSFLTDGNGRSLYLSQKDTPGKSNCDAACLQVWIPVLASGRVIAGPGVVQANLGVILLGNGTRQVTYLGAPLYYYSKDVNPGDTSGQGIDGVWFLVTP